MKRVVFIVEGDTELSFIQKCVIPYLYLKGFTNPMNAQKILTNRKRNKKGGNVGFDYLKNDVARVAAPSKRLMHIFPYEKTTDGEMILEALSIDDIRTRCPRFNEWMTKLEEGIRNDYF